VDDYDPRPFIASVTWTFARTMAHYNPHEYCVERDVAKLSDEHRRMFDEFVAYLNASETVRRYAGKPYRYVEVDGFTYWTTWGGGARTIVNRKPTAQAGWDDEPAGLFADSR
jgi:hypothetical protein